MKEKEQAIKITIEVLKDMQTACLEEQDYYRAVCTETVIEYLEWATGNRVSKVKCIGYSPETQEFKYIHE